jgi:hypothetical protein
MLDTEEQQAISVLADSGLVPPLRLLLAEDRSPRREGRPERYRSA